MNYLLAAKMRYYHNDNSETILSKVCDSISRNLSGCKHELLCIFDDIINIEPCCYWNRNVFEQTEKELQNLIEQNPNIFIDDEIFELFLAGYNAYMQVTNVINDLSGLNDSPAMKNRQYRIPTYVSIVEGCLTNLYRFIALIQNGRSKKIAQIVFKEKVATDCIIAGSVAIFSFYKCQTQDHTMVSHFFQL